MLKDPSHFSSAGTDLACAATRLGKAASTIVSSCVRRKLTNSDRLVLQLIAARNCDSASGWRSSRREQFSWPFRLV
jgi:hypothetical protein